MALAQFGGRGGTCEPGCERVFAGPRAGGAEHFEDAAFDEDVEVARIGVVGIAEAGAGFSVSGPVAVETVDCALVEIDGAAGAFHGAEDALVPSDDRKEKGDGREDPPPGTGIVVSEPSDECGRGKDEQAKIADAE